MAARQGTVRFDGATLVVVAAWLVAAWSFVGDPLQRWATGEPLLRSVAADTLGTAAVRGEAWVPVRDAGAAERLVSLVPGVLAVALLGLGVWWLVRLLAAARADALFDGSGLRLVQRLGALMIVGSLVVAFVRLATDSVVAYLAGDGDWFAGEVHVQPMWLVAGIVTMSLASAVGTGIRLRRDAEGLV
ncbi:MAG: hypothetical protein PGN07_09405 [Aeromicrobium erythreum]